MQSTRTFAMNTLYPSMKTNDIIREITSKRRQINRHGIKMLDGGKCPFEYCGYVNRNMLKSTFQEHVKQHHAIEAGYTNLTYTCGYCKTGFTSRSALNHHNINRHEAHRFSCNQCSYTAAQKITVACHIATKHEKWTLSACTNDNGECVICAKKLRTTGHMAHIAVCLDYTKHVQERKIIAKKKTRRTGVILIIKN
tara:strand:+ start:3108 stop:3695 length:588 start_codon:yes stop_codon:yes gene_type:complete